MIGEHRNLLQYLYLSLFMSNDSISSSSLKIRNMLSTSSIDYKGDNKSNIDTAFIRKACVLYNKVEASLYEIIENKFILQALEDTAKDTTEKSVQGHVKKLSDIINKWNIEKYFRLTSNTHDELCLLGIKNLPIVELSNLEVVQIEHRVQHNLHKKINQYMKIYEEERFAKEKSKSTENEARNRMMKKCFEQILLIDNIMEVINSFQKLIIDNYEQIQRWNNLKEEVYNLQIQKTYNLQLQSKVVQLKTMISEFFVTKKMYLEMPITIQAFQTLNSIIDNKLNLIDTEIENKRALKRKYNVLSGTEFDAILKDYIQITLLISNYKNILNKL